MKLFCPECKATYEDHTLELCPKDQTRLFTLTAEAQDPLLDAVIDGRFKIEALIGKGGMGAVYKGTQLSVNRKVAIKVLRAELLDRELALERFHRESRIISELSHPNIVRLIDFGQDRTRDLLYLVMELVDGVNLADVLARGRMRVALALEIAYQVCGALTEPHAREVIHRDLKPDNLLIVPVSDGTIQAKVLDFGIARALENNTQITATGMVCGTPQYMAPEQAQNQDISPRTDLYALGIILYEMLCGVPPFQGQNSLQVMLQHIQMTPSPLGALMPPGALPAEVEDLVNDMLAKNAERRPHSAREVRDRIDAIRRDYQLEPVRVEPSQARARLFDAWLLPPLPLGRVGHHEHTASLRRETDLTRRVTPGSAHSTDERSAVALLDTTDTPATEQISDAQRVEIIADGLRTPRHTPARGSKGKDFNLLDLAATTPHQPQPRAQPLVGATSSLERPIEVEPAPQLAATGASRAPLIALMVVVLFAVMTAGGVTLKLLTQPSIAPIDAASIAEVKPDDVSAPPEPIPSQVIAPQEVAPTLPPTPTPNPSTTPAEVASAPQPTPAPGEGPKEASKPKPEPKVEPKPEPKPSPLEPSPEKPLVNRPPAPKPEPAPEVKKPATKHGNLFEGLPPVNDKDDKVDPRLKNKFN